METSTPPPRLWGALAMVQSPSKKDAAVEDDRGVLAIAHPQRLGAGEAAQRDLARRRPPRGLVRPLPAVMGPAPRRELVLERRSVVMADRWRGHARLDASFRPWLWGHAGRQTPPRCKFF